MSLWKACLQSIFSAKVIDLSCNHTNHKGMNKVIRMKVSYKRNPLSTDHFSNINHLKIKTYDSEMSRISQRCSESTATLGTSLISNFWKKPLLGMK